MKKLLLLVLLCSVAFGQTYYVRIDGNDTLDGLSNSTAWQSLYQASNTVDGNDTILLRRGDTWLVTNNKRDGEAVGDGLYIKVDNITISTYGMGEKPIIDGSTQTDINDIRSTAAYSPIQVGIRYGHASTDVTVEGLDLRGPLLGQAIAAYSTGPNLVIRRCSINGSGWETEALIVAGSNIDNITIEDSHFNAIDGTNQAYSKSFEIRGGKDHIIRNNTFKGFTMGGAARFSNLGTGALIENNFFYNPDDRGTGAFAIVIRSCNGGKYIIRNNVIDLSGSNHSNTVLTAMRFWDDHAPTERIITHNTIISNHSGIAFNGHGSTTKVYNNILYETYRTYDGPDMTADFVNNIVWNPTRALTPDLNESGTIYSDPNLTNPSMSNELATDAMILRGSPAIDTGNNTLAELPTEDIIGTARPQGSGMDIGAFEFVGANHASDYNQDGCTNTSEITMYMYEWKSGAVTISEIIAGMNLWKECI